MSDTILVIEDNEQNRYLATFLLERRGYTVTPAIDGPRGLELAGDQPPTMILLEAFHPRMNDTGSGS